MINNFLSSMFLSQPFCFSDVDGKVIHLVERAPPQSNQSGGGGGGVSGSSGATDGGSTSSQSTTFPGTSHDRNANNYVMLGTFNLPVNIMDSQQIQVQCFPCVRVCNT